nr:MAG TPA_asm: hypothetical protein [Caudoviricetes sp.]
MLIDPLSMPPAPQSLRLKRHPSQAIAFYSESKSG